MSHDSTAHPAGDAAKKAKPDEIEGLVERIELTEPIEYGGKTWTEFTLRRRIFGRDLWGITNQLAISDVLSIGGRIAGVPESDLRSVLGELDPLDMANLVEQTNLRLEAYHATATVSASFDPSKPHEITLAHPVKMGSHTHTKVVLGKIKPKHIWETPANPTVGDLAAIAGRQATTHDELFQRMDAGDLGQVISAVNHCLKRFQPTG